MDFEMNKIISLDDFNGKLFISDSNDKTGKLLLKLNWFQDVFVDGLISEYNYYLDENNMSKDYKYIIRIMNLQGDEIFILKKPIKQDEIKIKNKEIKSYYRYKRGNNNISNSANEILNNNSK